jgi:hypothetical protein
MGAAVYVGFIARSVCMARPKPRAERCGRCSHVYSAEAWQRLEVVERIGADRIRVLVTSWPNGTGIEIRRCATCGAPIARKHAGE